MIQKSNPDDLAEGVLFIMETENWKDVVGYEGLYKVSNDGKILNRYGRINKPLKTKLGYHLYTLYKNKYGKKTFAHRIVADAFLKKENESLQVNHINGIKTDNRVENLEWCTASYNRKHAFIIGLQNTKGSKNSNSKKVIDTISLKQWDCAKDCANDLGLIYSTMLNWLNGYSKNNTSLKYK